MNLRSFIGGALAISLFACSHSSAPTQQEIEGMMRELSPAVDLANTPDSIFENAAEATLLAKQEMPWGSIVPEREFKHFVVPLRINNEPIDNHRPEIYAQLKERVKGLSMEEAIKEVNHWCHEYVVYQPSDSRTHSPLQSMSCLIGRCGEESTFTVAALRAVGIPARQVYTPRWAHTDDNHAWVEAWADGKWYFLGACEPEPELNLGWFNAPATRGMMMHTFVRGDYDGPEDVVSRNADGVTINVTSNYAPVTRTNVTVLDADGNPAKDAAVSFRVYNYAEFYPIASVTTDAEGKASCTTGLGDMVVWATDGTNYAWQKVMAGNDITLKLDGRDTEMHDFDIVPPQQGSNIVEVTDAQREENTRRMAAEDSIRTAKAQVFVDAETAAAQAKELGIDPEEWTRLMTLARGNGTAIYEFIKGLGDNKEKGLLLLNSISRKDLNDITAAILNDHIDAPIPENSEFYGKYLLSPRVYMEFLSPWRAALTEALAEYAEECKADPEKWVKIVKEQVEVMPDWSPSAIFMNPVPAWTAKKTNAASRDILFVAGARAMGIPARIDPVTAKPQWSTDGAKWNDAVLSPATDTPSAQGMLKLVADKENEIADPAYYTHFTISKIVDGKPSLLDFAEDATYTSEFAKPQPLDCGDYMIVSGQRLASGGVLTHTQFFTIEEGKTTEVPLSVRHDKTAIEVIGNFNSENKFIDHASGKERSILDATGRGYFVTVFLKPKHEPSNHVIRDINALSAEFEAQGTPIVFLSPENKDEILKDLNLASLPSTIIYGETPDGAMLAEALANAGENASAEYPLIMVSDTFNRVVYLSQGYTIGVGQQLLDILKRLK